MIGLAAPRRLEAEKRNLTQFLSSKDGSFGFVGARPKGLPAREMRRDIESEYLTTGANYFVCSFQWGDLTHAHAMRSIELFAAEVMERYAA